MLKLLPWARRTSHATRMLVSTRSVAALIAKPTRRYQATPVTQTPNRTMPEIDRAMIRGASPKAIPRRGAGDFPARIGESSDIFESPRKHDAIRPKGQRKCIDDRHSSLCYLRSGLAAPNRKSRALDMC